LIKTLSKNFPSFAVFHFWHSMFLKIFSILVKPHNISLLGWHYPYSCTLFFTMYGHRFQTIKICTETLLVAIKDKKLIIVKCEIFFTTNNTSSNALFKWSLYIFLLIFLLFSTTETNLCDFFHAKTPITSNHHLYILFLRIK
jgi:hypothetical protein